MFIFLSSQLRGIYLGQENSKICEDKKYCLNKHFKNGLWKREDPTQHFLKTLFIQSSILHVLTLSNPSNHTVTCK